MTVGSLTFVAGAFARSRTLDREPVFEPEQHRRTGPVHQGSVRFLRDAAQHSCRCPTPCPRRGRFGLASNSAMCRSPIPGSERQVLQRVSFRFDAGRAHRSDRRKRRRQNHAGETAGAPLRSHRRRDFARRRRSARVRRRQPARRNRRHLSGLHALRHAGPRKHRLRAHRRTAESAAHRVAPRAKAWPSR